MPSSNNMLRLSDITVDNETIGVVTETDQNGGNSATISINKATVNTLGVVKPDGTTITIDSNGIISAVGGGSGVSLADVSGSNITYSGGVARITWSDPSDVELSGAKLAEWSNTKVVRKEGSAPQSPTDGTLIVDSTTHNQYSTNAFVDDTLSGEAIFYYRFFVYSTSNTITKGTTLTVDTNRIAITTIPTQNGVLRYTGSTITCVWNDYDTDKMTVTGNTGVNAGTYTASFTPKDGYKWSDGTITAKDVTWTISPQIITTIPTQNGTITYDSTEKTAAWNNYDSTKMTVTGDIATNAGDHTATFTPTANYCWDDDSTTGQDVIWSIDKADGSVSLSTSSITLDKDNLTATVTVNSSTGNVTVISNDTSVATASYSNNTITISSVNSTTGSTTVTVNVDSSSNYNSTTTTITTTASFQTLVNWNNGSDADVKQMILDAQNELIDLWDYWAVGDERDVTVGAYTNTYNSSYNHLSETVTFVLMHKGGYITTDNKYVTGKRTNNDGAPKKTSFVVGPKNFFGPDDTNTAWLRMNSSNTNTLFQIFHKVRPSWRNSEARSFLNNATSGVLSAFPQWLQDVICTVNVITGDYNGNNTGGTNITTQDKLFFAAYREVFHDTEAYATTNESNALFAFEWYATSANRIKKRGNSGSASSWWLRSPRCNSSSGFCYVNSDGTRNNGDASGNGGCAPHYCI